MAEMGAMDEVIDAVLNHVKSVVIKVYNQYRYDKEKQATLDKWARRLQLISTGEKAKVVKLNIENAKKLIIILFQLDFFNS